MVRRAPRRRVVAEHSGCGMDSSLGAFLVEEYVRQDGEVDVERHPGPAADRPDRVARPATLARELARQHQARATPDRLKPPRILRQVRERRDPGMTGAFVIAQPPSHWSRLAAMNKCGSRRPLKNLLTIPT